MSETVELTKIFDSRGIDGLSRMDRAKSGYNRGQFLFEKYLKMKKEKPKVKVTHEHILGSFSKLLNNT